MARYHAAIAISRACPRYCHAARGIANTRDIAASRAISARGHDIGALPRYRARTTILLTGLHEIVKSRDIATPHQYRSNRRLVMSSLYLFVHCSVAPIVRVRSLSPTTYNSCTVKRIRATHTSLMLRELERTSTTPSLNSCTHGTRAPERAGRAATEPERLSTNYNTSAGRGNDTQYEVLLHRG